MLLRRDSSDITIVRVQTLTVASSLSLTVSYVDVTLTVTALTDTAQSQITLTQADSSSLSTALSLMSLLLAILSPTTLSIASETLASLSSGTQSAMSLTSASWETYSSSLDTNLGLAIGIPMAVVALVAVVCVGWIIFRKVRSRLRDVLKLEKEQASLHALTEGSSSVEWAGRPELPRSKFLNRLSRIVDWPASPTSFCPPILRRFHLLGPAQLPVPPTPPEKPNATRVVVRPYTKRLGDELSLVVGQTVRLLKSHLDGWALVSHDGVQGVVPQSCLGRP